MNKYMVFKMVDKGYPEMIGEVTASSWRNAIRYYSSVEEGYFAVFLSIDSVDGK